MKLETPFIAIAMAALVFTGLFTLFIGMAQEYSVTYDETPLNLEYNGSTFSSTFDQVNATKTEMDKVSDNFYDETVFDTGSLFGFFKFTYKLGKQIFLNMGLIKTMLFLAAAIIGIPGSIIATFIAILMLVFTISVIMIIMGRVND